jgi:hypothetical protein
LVKVAKKDWIAIAVIAAVLAAVLAGTLKQKAKNVPHDEKHIHFNEVMLKGGDRMEAEKRCITCHGVQSIPLPPAHPPKEHCLLCHKIVKR